MWAEHYQVLWNVQLHWLVHSNDDHSVSSFFFIPDTLYVSIVMIKFYLHSIDPSYNKDAEHAMDCIGNWNVRERERESMCVCPPPHTRAHARTRASAEMPKSYMWVRNGHICSIWFLILNVQNYACSYVSSVCIFYIYVMYCPPDLNLRIIITVGKEYKFWSWLSCLSHK